MTITRPHKFPIKRPCSFQNNHPKYQENWLRIKVYLGVVFPALFISNGGIEGMVEVQEIGRHTMFITWQER